MMVILGHLIFLWDLMKHFVKQRFVISSNRFDRSPENSGSAKIPFGRCFESVELNQMLMEGMRKVSTVERHSHNDSVQLHVNRGAQNQLRRSDVGSGGTSAASKHNHALLQH